MTPVPVADPVLTARIYRETRERISELVTGLDAMELSTASEVEFGRRVFRYFAVQVQLRFRTFASTINRPVRIRKGGAAMKKTVSGDWR